MSLPSTGSISWEAQAGQLQALFPNIPSEIIIATLDKFFGDVEIAADALMALDESQIEAMKFRVQVSPSSKNPASRSRGAPKTPTRDNRSNNQNKRPGWGGQGESNRRERHAEYVGSSRVSAATSSSFAPTRSQVHQSEIINDVECEFNYEDDTTLTDDQVYQSFRSAAMKAKRQRDKLREQAQGHYLRGEDTARRDKLSQARVLSQEIQQLNDRAAAHIFEFKNRPSLGMGNFKMDLHGLHAREAIRFLDERLQALAVDMADIFDVVDRKELVAIVGKGIHQRGQIMLQPTVQQYLEFSRVQFRWRPEEGSFRITVPKKFESRLEEYRAKYEGK